MNKLIIVKYKNKYPTQRFSLNCEQDLTTYLFILLLGTYVSYEESLSWHVWGSNPRSRGCEADTLCIRVKRLVHIHVYRTTFLEIHCHFVEDIVMFFCAFYKSTRREIRIMKRNYHKLVEERLVTSFKNVNFRKVEAGIVVFVHGTIFTA